MTLVFIDTETTGLDPDRHEIWELAFAIDDGPIHSGPVPHSLRHADPFALDLNGYHSRFVDARPGAIEPQCRRALTGATLVAANPAFDAAFLRARWGETPWHYRLWDVEAYAAGVLGMHTLTGLAGVADALRSLGHDIPDPNHTAAADVATLQATFYALHSISTEATK